MSSTYCSQQQNKPTERQIHEFTDCEERDAAVYSLWPILPSHYLLQTRCRYTGTSLLILPRLFVAPLLIFKECTHMFAVASLALSGSDLFVHYVRKKKHMCNRNIFAEINTLLAFISFIGASFVHTFALFVEEDMETSLDRYDLLLCQLIPYCLIVIATIGQCLYILFVKTEND